ncbi:MAG: RNA pseudouridine synthase [Luteolibacter sp.]|uniref:RluA family pseudouridine synthase n=1 Tax=Luteolibacter sp. TaxID=1962973 RepID=UPI0032648FF4
MSLQVVVNFNVIDESEDWIVVNKPAPLIVHPANCKPEPTLLGGLESLLAFEIANGATLGIVTRLDRDTSGIVLVAKNTEAARQLGWIFERREAEKEYLAIVTGWPEEDRWECAEPIIRAGERGPSEIWVRQVVSPLGRECLTRFQVERRFERDEGKFSLVRCFPETGRMHQIRVHLASSGFPIVGDKIYSGNGAGYLEWMETGWTTELKKRLILPRHALHAAALEIVWSGSLIRWEAELSQDMREFLDGTEISATPGVVIWSRHD